MKRSEMLVGGISLLDEGPIAKELRENEEFSRKEQEGIENTREAHKAVLEELIEVSPEDRVSQFDSEEDLLFKFEEDEYDSEIPQALLLLNLRREKSLRPSEAKLLVANIFLKPHCHQISF